MIAASLFFYGWWDIRFVPIILGSILANYLIGQKLQSVKSKLLLTFGITANLLLLAIYKYADFTITTYNNLSGNNHELLKIALPLAISFFTFQQIAYLVDSYQNKVTDDSRENYLLFVLFFPQLIAGPIVHHSEMMPQYMALKKLKEVTSEYITSGLILIFVGLFKKIVIADSLAGWVTPVFANPESIGVLDAWTGVLAYTFQIYFDFSAYSEMAMGIALLFGIKLPINFDSPYQSTSITDFWRRWHITLGRFLRQYLYIPLGGNKNGSLTAIYALTITMLLGGLWHGAGWQYVLWGILHGLFLTIAYLWSKTGYRMHRIIATGITFLAVVIAWVPFRAETIQDALIYWHAMFDLSNFSLQPLQSTILSPLFGKEIRATMGYFKGWELGVIFIIMVAVMEYRNIHYYLDNFKPTLKNYVYLSSLSMIALAIMGHPQSFIYYNF